MNIRLAALCLLSINVLFAQDPQRQIGAGTGLSFVAIKAQTTSPLTYKRAGLPVHVIFDNGAETNRHIVQAFYQVATLKNSVNNSIRETRIGFQYCYHRKLYNLKNGLHIYGGGAVSSQTSLRQGTGINSRDGNSFAGVDVSVLSAYSMGKNRFEGQLSATVAAFTIRPTYSLSPPDEARDPLLRGKSERSQAVRFGRWSSFDDFYQLSLRISCDRSLTKRLSGRVDYKWNLHKYRGGAVFESLAHQLITSIVYKF